MTIEDEFTNEELNTLQAQWNQKEQEERFIFEREILLKAIIAHHELDKIRGSNTAMAYAESNGLKSEFEQYLTETVKEQK